MIPHNAKVAILFFGGIAFLAYLRAEYAARLAEMALMDRLRPETPKRSFLPVQLYPPGPEDDTPRESEP